MKWIPFVLNLVAAVAFLWLGSVAASVHRTHSYSMYREFVSLGAVDEARLKTLPPLPRSPEGSHYDMPSRMREIGAAEGWFSLLASLASLACLVNGVVIFFLTPGRGPIPEA